jgi:hypothetical protein
MMNNIINYFFQNFIWSIRIRFKKMQIESRNLRRTRNIMKRIKTGSSSHMSADKHASERSNLKAQYM